MVICLLPWRRYWGEGGGELDVEGRGGGELDVEGRGGGANV